MGIQNCVSGLLRQFGAAISVLTLILSGSFVPLAKVFAGGSTVSVNAPATLVGQPGQSIAITGVSVTENGNPNVPVHIDVEHGSLSLSVTMGLTFATPASTPYTGSVLEFSGSLTNVNAALASLHYTASSLGGDTLDISLTEPGEVYDPTNGHLYKYVDTPSGMDWNDAKTAADASSEDGVSGYLATLTSADENSFIGTRVQHDAWIAASDLAVNGTWRWVDGPESGTQFWSEPVPAAGGNAVNGGYANWNGSEPNDGAGNGREDCVEYYSNPSQAGYWNDLPCTDTSMTGYLIEYGDGLSLPDVTSNSVAITNSGATVTPTTCTQLMALDDNPGSEYDTINLTNDIDCTNLSVAPLFSDYNTFPDGFLGVLNGQGHTISGYQLNYNDDNAGLFAMTTGATIENLRLTDGSVYNNDDETGALIGYAVATNVTNVSSSWTVASDDEDVGGLIGYLENDDSQSSTISQSSVSGNVTGDNENDGGIIGYVDNEGGTLVVNQTAVTANVDGQYAEAVGGIVGVIENEAEYDHDGSITIQDIYVTGDIGNDATSYYDGGIVGELENDGDSPYKGMITIARGYVSGAVHSSEYSGGIVGGLDDADQYATTNLQDLFITGPVTPTSSPDYAGVLLGYNDGDTAYVTSTDNYFDQDSVGLTACTGPGDNDITGTCTGINTVAQPNYFKGTHSRTPMTNWNFNTVWRTNTASYPTFGVGDDNDGSSSSSENAGPNSGDANNDGQQDSQETNVTSLVDSLSNKYAVLESSGSCADNSNVSIAPESANSVTDSDFSYPLGLMNFTLTCSGPGQTTSVTQYYYGSYNPSNYILRKYNPTTHSYSPVAGVTLSNVTIGGQAALKVTYPITDGGALDTDSTANGQITDPVGLAQSVSQTTVTTGALSDTGIDLLLITASSIVLLAAAYVVRRRI